MLKHEELIKNLSAGQKIALLSGEKLKEAEYAEKGIPVFSAVNLQDINKSPDSMIAYPSLNSLANSWNIDLIEKISAELALRVKKYNVSAVVTPDCGVNMHVYKSGISEDPYLSGMLAAGYAKGIANTGLTPVLANCSLNAADTEFMDQNINNNVIRDCVVKPFQSAARKAAGAVIMTSFTRLKGSYSDVNTGVINKILNEKKNGGTIICDKADDELAVAGLQAGNTAFLYGNSQALEAAYQNYQNLKQSLEKGLITSKDLQAACLSGKALSDEMLDSAADKFIEFAFESRKRFSATVPDADTADAGKLSLQASQESVVLLKNAEKTLPLNAETKVAVIGQMATLSENPAAPSFIEVLSRAGKKAPFQYTGYADGYYLNEDKSDALIPAACRLVEKSDIAVLFLGIDNSKSARIPETRCLTLPANQLALIDALKKTGKKIIAVISGDYIIDTSFDKLCAALILMPPSGMFGTHSAETLCGILSGAINPSGKLTSTYYDEPDKIFSELKINKHFGKIKIGSFFGYRHYDTANEKIKYPFGHGLSYTDFIYSDLSADESGATFRVKNTGKQAGAEIVQLYIGKKGTSSVVRPLKELKGFERIYLEPGQSTVVNFQFSNEDFAVSTAGGEFAVEEGLYNIYAGASVSDIRLEQSVKIRGQALKAEEGRLSDYLQNETNIGSGKYTLEPESYKNNRTRNISLLTMLIAAIFDIVIALTGAYGPIVLILLVIINLGALVAIIALIVDSVKFKKQYPKKQAPQTEPAKNESAVSEESPFEKMFLEEFNTESASEEETAEVPVKADNLTDLIDNSLDLKTAALRLAAFTTGRGLALSYTSAIRILSAMYASRILILRSAEQALLPDFTKYLSDYFGTPVFTHQAVEKNEGQNQDEKENRTETVLAKAIAAAEENNRLIHIVVLKGFNPDGIEECLMPFAGYMDNPDKQAVALVKNESGTEKATALPPNLWFVTYFTENERGDNIPKAWAEIAVAVDIELYKTKESPEKSPVQRLGFQHFLKLGNDSEERYSVSENMWKKLDKLEDYVNTRASYRIGNKEWQRIEKYTSVYLACEMTETDALDNVIAAKLMPSIVPLIISNPSGEEDSFTHTLEKILGEENAAACVAVAKRSGLAAANQK